MRPSPGKGRFYVPVVCAALVLFLPYALRNLVVAPVALEVAEEVVSRRLGRPVSIDVGKFSGSWFWDLSLQDVSFEYGDGPFPLRSLRGERISLEYSPEELLTTDALAMVKSVEISALSVRLNRRPTVEEIEEEIRSETDLTATQIRKFLRRRAGTPRLDVEMEILLPGTAGTQGLSLAVEGQLEDSLAVNLGLGSRTLTLSAVRIPGELRIRTTEESSLPWVITADLRAARSTAPGVTGNLTLDTPEVSAGLRLVERTLEVAFETSERFFLEIESLLEELSLPLLALPKELHTGTLRTEITLSLLDSEPRTFFEALLSAETDFIDIVAIEGTAEAEGWRYAGSPNATAFLGAAWDPADRSIAIEGLRVEAMPLGRARISRAVLALGSDASVTLPTAASVEIPRVGELLSLLGVQGPSWILPLRLDGEVTSESFSVNFQGPSRIQVEGTGNLRRGTVDSGSFDVGLLTLDGGDRLNAQGSYRGSFLDDAGRLWLDFDAVLEKLSAPSFPGTLSADIALQGPPERPLFEVVFRVSELRVEDTVSSITGAVRQEANELVFEEVVWDGDEGTRLVVAARFPVVLPRDRPSIEDLLRGHLRIDGTIGGLRPFVPPDARRLFPPGAFDVSGETTGRKSDERGLDVSLSGENIDIDLFASGTEEVPRFDLDFRVAGVRIGGASTELKGRLSQDERGVALHGIEGRGEDGLSFEAKGRLPIRLEQAGLSFAGLRGGSLSLDGDIPVLHPFLPQGLRSLIPGGPAHFDGRLEEETGDLSFRLTFEGVRREEYQVDGAPLGYTRVTVTVRLLETDRNRIASEARLSFDERDVVVQTGELVIPGIEDDAPRFRLPGLRYRGETEVDVPVSIGTAFLPELVYGEGTVEGSIASEGPLTDLRHDGALDLLDVGFRLSGGLPPVTALNGRVLIRSEGLELVEGTGELGRAPFQLTGAYRAGESASERRLEATLRGRSLLLASQPGIRVRSDVDLAARGPLSDLSLTGSLSLTDVRYTRDVPLLQFDSPPTVSEDEIQLFSVPGPFGASTSLNIQVSGDDTVTIANNVYRGTLSVDTRLRGTLEVPVLTGRVFADSGTVRLPVTDLSMTNISLEFPPENPFSPVLRAQGESQIRGYDIYVNAYGTVPVVEVQVSSNPPLPREQAILLLTTGHADIRGLGEGQRGIVTAGRFLSRRIGSLLLGPESQAEESVLDRVDISVGRRLSRSGNEVIEVDFRLGPGESWFLEFERDEYDRYNLSLAWRFSFR